MFYSTVTIEKTGETVRTGWLPPMPDLRDYTEETPVIEGMLEKIDFKIDRRAKKPQIRYPFSIPERQDLRHFCSPIENQGQLGSCTAHAALGIVEYFERRAFDEHIDGSRLFVYKATRDLMGVTGDTGAWLRNTMGALKLCGVPPERYWPYTDQDPDFDRAPSSFVYAVADNYEATKYFCHDPVGVNSSGPGVLSSVKRYLAFGIPAMFGFFGFPSSSSSEEPGDIPYPCPNEKAIWGHAVMAVGYDDARTITNTKCGSKTTGALLIRNSWGVSWGDRGYGWLPYKYVEDRLALDFWSLLNMDWVGTGQFGLDA